MMRVRFSEVELLDMGDEIWEELIPNAEVATQKGADVIVAEARANLSRRRGTARSAAPAGEAPEYDEGELHDSIKRGKSKRTKYGVRTEYGSDHLSAGLHEFGGTVTRNGKRRTYPPRPYLRPAEASTETEVERILEAL